MNNGMFLTINHDRVGSKERLPRFKQGALNTDA